jgi:F-type H+-transporting ATPase subunit delta
LSGVKTFSNETSERYALALFELANENSEVEDIERNIITIQKIFTQNAEFNNFLKNPTHQIEIQSVVFAKIAEIMGLKKILKNFLQLIIKKRRIYFLDKILKKFMKLASKRKGKVEALLVSSKNLTKDERNSINEEISKVIKSTVNFSFKTDKDLISGVKIQVGSLLIDTSFSNKLKRIKQSMIEN